MYALGLILIAYLVGPSAAIPIGYGTDFPDIYNGYYNGYYQPCIGSNLCRSLFPSGAIGNIYPGNYLSSAAAVGSDLLSTLPADYAYNYPYGSPRNVNFAKENYIRDYGFGSSEVGIRDQVSVRSNAPVALPPYSRVCSYLPIGTCLRGVNRYPVLPGDFDVAF